MSLRNVGVLLFDQAELLDFAGPLQVFASFRYLYPDDCDKVITIGMSDKVHIAKLGMFVTTDVTIDHCTDTFDILIVPGGQGTRELIKSPDELHAIRSLLGQTKVTASVCTGSLVLAQLGLLQNKKSTTHYGAIELLQSIDPSTEIDRSKRFHDHDSIVVSEGVSAGIDMSLYLIAKYYGQEKSDAVKKYIEYYPEK